MSDNILKMMEQDSGQTGSLVEKVDQEGLTSVASLARQIREKELYIKDLETDLKAANKELQKLTDDDMPSMLAEIGISSFALDDGSTVEVKATYGASILVENRPQAYEWLRDKTAVHPQTLRAFVKERVEEGDDFPMELFGAYVGQRAVINIKKGK